MSVIVLDRQVDLTERLLPALVALGVRPENLYLLDAGDSTWTMSWNPLLGAGEAATRSGAFRTALKRRAESWGVQIDESVGCASHALALTGYSPLEIDPLLGNATFRASVLSRITDSYTRQFFSRFEELSTEQKQTWRSAVANKLAPFLANERLCRILCGTKSIDLSRIVDDPKAILLVSLRGDRLQEGADVLGELLVGAIWNAVLARSDRPEDERPRTSLIIDEFQNFGTSIFKEMIAEGRRYKCHLILAHQSLSQVEPGLRGLIRNNAAVRVLFSPGPVDAEELTRELAPMAKSEAYAALMSLKVGEAYVVKRGQRAVRVQTDNPPRPDVEAAAVETLRAEALACHCQRIKDVDAEIAERLNQFQRLDVDPTTLKEVRHERKPQIFRHS